MESRRQFYTMKEGRADASADSPQPTPAVAENSVRTRAKSLEFRKRVQTYQADFANTPPSENARPRSVGAKPSGDHAIQRSMNKTSHSHLPANQQQTAVAVPHQQPAPAAPACLAVAAKNGRWADDDDPEAFPAIYHDGGSGAYEENNTCKPSRQHSGGTNIVSKDGNMNCFPFVRRASVERPIFHPTHSKTFCNS